MACVTSNIHHLKQALTQEEGRDEQVHSDALRDGQPAHWRIYLMSLVDLADGKDLPIGLAAQLKQRTSNHCAKQKAV